MQAVAGTGHWETSTNSLADENRSRRWSPGTRPFIVAPNFIGPDRRRHKQLPPRGERRVAKASDIEVSHEQ